MPELDRLKGEIGWLKVVFALLVAADLSLPGWLAQNLGVVLCPISNCRNFAVIPAKAGIQKSLLGAGFRPIPGRNDESGHVSVFYGTAH
ncbi:MAG: hypothetical protein ACREVE_08560 [Gammaproteobacteria bacterium]